MVPSHYVNLKELPLTPSKKVDYNLLPKPEKLNKTLTSEFVEPTTKEEITIDRDKTSIDFIRTKKRKKK